MGCYRQEWVNTRLMGSNSLFAFGVWDFNFCITSRHGCINSRHLGGKWLVGCQLVVSKTTIPIRRPERFCWYFRLVSVLTKTSYPSPSAMFSKSPLRNSTSLFVGG